MSGNAYVAVRIEGGLLPSSMLGRLSLAGDAALPGLTGADYGLAAGESVREAANRVWAYLRTAWMGYRAALDALPEGDRATSLTRDRWLHIVLDQLGYGRVPQTPAGGLVVGSKSFAVSHQWGQVPIHLLGSRIDLDRRTTGVAGAAGQAPQSMVQELLNRSDDHLWAMLSNGLTLRLLRDSTSLVGSAYVDFDLEAIFEGELFSDFVVLYTLAHSSRLAVREPEVGPASCWLETWREVAVEAGSRALDQLREGVVSAIEALGTGFLAHPSNGALRERVEAGELSLSDLNHGLLRVVYRLLFTFVAEDRGVLLDPGADSESGQRYQDYFSTARLRAVARRRRGGRHGDRWRALSLVWASLARPEGRPELGLVGIGGLYDTGELDVFAGCELSNEALLAAVRSLSLVNERGSGVTRVVDYRALDSEELGSIYESLLEFVPRWDVAERTYRLGSGAGNTRKTTGSYYTPTSLIDTLLDSALDPVIAAAVDGASSPEEAESSLLSLTVCDPACGSGHFLVAAARRIAKAVAAVRTGDPEPPPETVRSALREVVSRCIYGVDINPLAAELAKVSLWLEAMEPGRPLTFLDAHVRVGNALLGATPALLAQPLPQEAFKAIIGDAKPVASATAKRNKAEAGGQDDLFGDSGVHLSNADLATAAAAIGGPALSLADAHVQGQRLRQYESSPEYRVARRQADAWCAAFVWRMVDDAPECPTTATVRSIGEGGGAPDVLAEVDRLAAEYRFFHWHLEFPDVFPTERPDDGGSLNEQTGWYGGYDVVLGNPPWEHVELKEQEFFDARDPEVAQAAGAKRKKMIAGLVESNPPLHAEYEATKRRLDGLRHFASVAGRFPLCGRGRIKTDPIFAEMSRHVLSATGRVGIIVPTGIATDATTQHFFKDLVFTKSLASLYDFENRRPLFEGVDSRFKFCLLTLGGGAVQEARADFAFFAHHPRDLERDEVRFTLTPEEISVLNPNTGTCPVFRNRRDAEITLGIYRRVPVLINENDPVNGNPWGISFMQGLFNMTSDSHLFHTREELEADGWTLNGNIFEREISNGGGGDS
ncbi:N-6 DNA methylase [Janibacter melonis]|uniref:Eco57I restriction-modification methylase domain-containing protein n=1 Tax=Janibacter melonis TaxID=262209 RepID=UPI00204352B2|nr:N-6 DNA methylase [Janibacter melonis]MCM3554857.1 N-6 DNA methylase [Janibacter melonis]